MRASTSAMEPFRAFVGDQLSPSGNGPAGYAMQTFFIGVGAVVASMLPWILEHAGVSKCEGSGAGAIPDTVRYSFYFGAARAGVAMLWTVFTTREYPPGRTAQLRRCDAASPRAWTRGSARVRKRVARSGSAAGCSRACSWSGTSSCDPPLYLLARYVARLGRRAAAVRGAAGGWSVRRTLMADIDDMPARMRAAHSRAVLFLARFVRDVDVHHAAVTQVHFGSTDAAECRIQRRRELGGRAVRGVQRIRGAGRDRDSAHGAAAGHCSVSHMRQPVARRRGL